MAKRDSKSEYRSTKSNVCQERQIKVHQTHYERHRQPVPWINFKGFWLEQAGFTINTPVKIRVMNGCLVLTAEDNSEGEEV